MNTPLISIIVPVYNAEEHLNKCVESIVNQTYKNLEIILVDDGSSDSSPELCDDWAKKDSRIIVVHKENGGVSSARNAGLDIVSGSYIGFADNDDSLDSDMVEFLFNNLIEYDADISRCSFRFYYEDDNSYEEAEINDEIRVIENKNELLEDLYNFGYKCGVLWNRLYKRSVVENVRLNPILKSGGEDILFNYYANKNCQRMVCCDVAKYTYVMHIKNGIGGINFNYFMYLAMHEIISDSEAPQCMYHKFYVFAYMTLHDIVVRNLHQSFSDVRQSIINNKQNILLTEQVKYDTKSRLRMFLLQYFPSIYKFLLKVK